MTSKTLTAACLAALVLSIASAAHAGTHKCSLSTVAGTYGLTTTGSIPAIGPVGAVGLVTIHKSGNLSGSQTRSLNGAVADETFTRNADFGIFFFDLSFANFDPGNNVTGNNRNGGSALDVLQAIHRHARRHQQYRRWNHELCRELSRQTEVPNA